MAREQAGGSFPHRLDPRTKLLLTAVFTVLVFIIDTVFTAAAQAVLFVALGMAAGIPPRKLFAHGKFLLFLIVFILVLQTLFGMETTETRYIYRPLVPEFVPLIGGLGSLKFDGLVTGLMICCRVTALTVLMPLLTLTTDPPFLVLGLVKLGLNYRTAYIITSTLNLIPSFEEEASLILDARRLRGSDAGKSGGLLARLAEYRAVAFPLMVKAMRKARIIGLAMDSRAYGAYRTRTWTRNIKMSVTDFAAVAAGIIWCGASVSVNFILHYYR